MHNNELPLPGGPYVVGSTSCGLTDHDRTAHLSSEDQGRVIIVKVWYPADESTPQATQKEMLWHELRDDPNTPGMMKLLLRRTAKIATHSLVQPDFSTRISRPRILIYHHGMISFAAENTFLMEDLASHGYIVIALQHAAQLAELKALQGMQPNNIRKQQAQLENRIRKAVGENRAALSKEYYQSASNTNRIVAARAQDTGYVLDNVMEVLGAIPGIKDCDIPTEIVGIIGYSVGGAVATDFAKSDVRAAWVVNMDGGIYGEHRDQPLSSPCLMLYSAVNHGCNASALLTQHPATIICKTIDHTKHMNYHEIAMIYPSLRWLGITGKADPLDVIKLRNQYIIEFIQSIFSV